MLDRNLPDGGRSTEEPVVGEVGIGNGPSSEPLGLRRPEEVDASLLRSFWRDAGVLGRLGVKELTDSLYRVDDSAVLNEESGRGAPFESAAYRSRSALFRWSAWK